MSRVIVYHSAYGCDTGCTGHVVEVGDKSRFVFDSPWPPETPREFAERLVREHFGEEHVMDLDWDNCVVEER